MKYEGNNSKQWDGREILVDKSYLESLYDTDELQPGMLVTLPWTGKGGRASSWKARIVVESKAKAIESTLKGYNFFCWIAIIIYFLYIGKGKGKSKGKVAAKGCTGMHTVQFEHTHT